MWMRMMAWSVYKTAARNRQRAWYVGRFELLSNGHRKRRAGEQRARGPAIASPCLGLANWRMQVRGLDWWMCLAGIKHVCASLCEVGSPPQGLTLASAKGSSFRVSPASQDL